MTDTLSTGSIPTPPMPSQPVSAAPVSTTPKADWWRPLGRSSLTVSAICLGSTLLNSRRQGATDRGADTSDALVRRALAHHIRFFDEEDIGVAHGSDRTEGAISGTGRLHESIVVATTVTADESDLSGRRMQAAVAARAQRLGTPTLPLVYLCLQPYQPFDATIADGGPLDTLVALRAAGQVGAIGVAGSDMGQLIRCVDLGVLDAVRVHGRWTLLDRSADALLDHAAAAGIAVVNADVYAAGGLLHRPGGESYSNRLGSPVAAEAARAMDLVCRWWGTDLATAALLFSFREPRITSTVTGFIAPSDVTSVLAALDNDLVEPFWDELETLLPLH